MDPDRDECPMINPRNTVFSDKSPRGFGDREHHHELIVSYTTETNRSLIITSTDRVAHVAHSEPQRQLKFNNSDPTPHRSPGASTLEEAAETGLGWPVLVECHYPVKRYTQIVGGRTAFGEALSEQ